MADLMREEFLYNVWKLKIVQCRLHNTFFYAEAFCCAAREALMSVVLTFIMALRHYITPLTNENLLYYSGVTASKWSKDAARFCMW